ncbi:MAG: PEP-CTERM sorting domain-containing protein, partial [Phycisphaeraceae bacterium]
EFAIDTRVSFHADWIDSNISLLGDFNDDGLVNAADIDLLFAEVAAGTHDPFFELTSDAFVDQADVDELVLNILGSLFGDANLDLAVSFADFTALQNNFGLAGGWANANFNGDALITFSDFSILQNNFGQSGTGAPTSVPEPATIMLMALGSVGLLARRRRSSPLS